MHIVRQFLALALLALDVGQQGVQFGNGPDRPVEFLHAHLVRPVARDEPLENRGDAGLDVGLDAVHWDRGKDVRHRASPPRWPGSSAVDTYGTGSVPSASAPYSVARPTVATTHGSPTAGARRPSRARSRDARWAHRARWWAQASRHLGVGLWDTFPAVHDVGTPLSVQALSWDVRYERFDEHGTLIENHLTRPPEIVWERGAHVIERPKGQKNPGGLPHRGHCRLQVPRTTHRRAPHKVRGRT